MPGLERILDACDRPGRVTRLARLEVDLGPVAAGDLVRAMRERLPGLVSRALEERLAALDARAEGAVPGTSWADALEDEERSPGQASLQVLIHYLRTGLRPWWAVRRDWYTLLREAASALSGQDPVGHLWRSLPSPSARNLRRLAGTGAWPAVAAAVASGLSAGLVDALEARGDELGVGPWSGRLLALVLVLMRSPGADADVMGAMVARCLEPEELRAWLKDNTNEPVRKPGPWPAPLIAVLEAGLLGGEREPVPDGGKAARTKGAPSRDRADEPVPRARRFPTTALEPGQAKGYAGPPLSGGGSGSQASAETVSSPSSARPVQWPAAEETIAIVSAGAVILQPFLETLFRTLGMVSDQRRFLAGGQRRGVALLGYLVWGDVLPPDPDLALEKLLCGLLPGEPWLPLEISEAERLEGAKVLDAVLRHWTALKSTSRDGLRQSFLQRPGRLETDAAGLRLRVERRAWDLLLNRLPWPISVVRLPWMRLPLTVDWQ